MGSARCDGNRRHRPRRKDHRVQARARKRLDDLLDGHERSPGREHGFLLDPDDALEEHVALPVGFLRVNDRDVGSMGRHGRERFASEGTGDEFHVGVHAGQIGAEVAAEERRRHAGRASGVGMGHGGVTVLLNLNRVRPSALDGIPQPMERPHAGIAAPGEHELPGGAAADHLVVEQVGRHPDQREIAKALTDDFVPGGERNEVGEPFEGDRVAGVDELADCVGKTEKSTH